MKRVEGYVTTEGGFFTDREAAVKQQAHIDLVNTLKKDTAHPHEYARAILKNAVAVHDALSLMVHGEKHGYAEQEAASDEK